MLPNRADDRRRRGWAGVPPDERRAERRARLLDAAYELLGSEGWDRTTVRAVCQRAQLNPRYFYESFADLDALVVAVYDRIVEDMAASVVRAQAEAPPGVRAQTRAAIDSIVRFVDDDRRRGRVLYVEALGSEALNRRRIETGHRLVEAIARDAAARAETPAVEQLSRVGASMLVGGFGELLAAWLDGRIELDRDELVEDATALFLAVGAATATLATRRTTPTS